MAACTVLTPAEELFIVKRCGGALVEHKSVIVCGTFPGGFPVLVLLNEIVKGAGCVSRIGGIHARHCINAGKRFIVANTAHEGYNIFVRGQNARIGIDRHGNIGPPIYGGIAVKGIHKAHMGIEVARALRQMEIDLPEDGLVALKFVNTKEIVALAVLQDRGVNVVAGGVAVTEVADVPFNTAREPSVAVGKVAGLDHGVGKKKLSAVFLIKERVQSSAVFGKKACREILVLQHEALHGLLFKIVGISVLHQVGKHLDLAAERFGKRLGKALADGSISDRSVAKMRKRTAAAERGCADLEIIGPDLHKKRSPFFVFILLL